MSYQDEWDLEYCIEIDEAKMNMKNFTFKKINFNI